MTQIAKALCRGYECLVSWADLLDRINVYPVADGDTGTNLKISLAPLRDFARDKKNIGRQLALAALGNSGNIAAAFFGEFIKAENFAQLAAQTAAGRDQAWAAVRAPQEGTMLTVFASLAEILADEKIGPEQAFLPVGDYLQKAVPSGVVLLPELEQAGVVDSGALGMFIYFDGFFKSLAGCDDLCPVTELFKGRLRIRDSYNAPLTGSYCVDAVIDVAGTCDDLEKKLDRLGESLVLVPDESCLKIHIHTPDPVNLLAELDSAARVVKWSKQDLDARNRIVPELEGQAIHIVTDAAGSITRKIATNHGITLLDSYIVSDAESRPESCCSPEQIYSCLRKGGRLSTAQASTFERRQCYEALIRQFPAVLYLCVGAVFTGNYAAVTAWKKNNDPTDRLKVYDTGAASGRLAVIALLTARFAGQASSPDQVIDFAGQAIENCQEYVFIDQLKYLAAGGRLAKTGGFFGDLLRMKPVITPTRQGAKKVGVVHNRAGQLQFALDRLGEKLSHDFPGLIMLQYSDNKKWLAAEVQARIYSLYPQAEIMLTPLSLTSGVHMGPGSWGVAFLP